MKQVISLNKKDFLRQCRNLSYQIYTEGFEVDLDNSDILLLGENVEITLAFRKVNYGPIKPSLDSAGLAGGAQYQAAQGYCRS